MLKINFGCGSIQPRDWINVDDSPEFNAKRDISDIEDDSADMIVAHAVIQQLDWHGLVEWLIYLRRKLKIGAVLRISLPDIQRGFKALEEYDHEWFPNNEDDIHERFSAWLTWYSTSVTLLTPEALIDKLKEAGFEFVQRVGFKQSVFSDNEITELDTRENEFYFMEARK